MNLDLFDTHCHIHEMVRRITPVYDKWHGDNAERTSEGVIAAAHEAGVSRMLCIGTSLADSELAVEFAAERGGIWTSIGVHPHEAALHLDRKRQFAALLTDAQKDKIVAIGECGLDYFYKHSPKEAQIEMLRFQIELALEHDLPLSFHVREAFQDFWPVFDSYEGAGLRGVLHSFTDTTANLDQAMKRGLYIGVNGIATFAKATEQQAMYRAIPLNKLVLETDAPFLTPVPFRGKVCEPKHIRVTAEFLANLRSENLDELASAATSNARALFGI